MRDRAILFLAVAALVAAACGGGATTTTEGPDESATSTTTTQPDTTTSAPTSTTTTSSDAAFTKMKDFTYLMVDGEAFEGDIYVPEGEGPWPVVVMFHGNPDTKDGRYTTVVAEAAAAAGMYVFVPNWLTGVTRFTPELFDFFSAAANCAVAYAQPDPDVSLPVVVYGFSAGVGPASGAALGDGEYFLQSTIFDGAFAADLEAMQARVATIVDPSLWPADMETRFFLWFADGGTAPRGFGDPWDETGWLAQRDPDGSIRDDLDRLGQLDDGVISFIDEAQFMALRLEEAGIEVTLDNYPGRHTTLDKVPELVGYLTEAAAIP